MNTPSKQSMIGSVIAVLTCASMVLGGVWHASAETEKLKGSIDKLEERIKLEDAKITEAKEDTKDVKKDTEDVKATCNDIKREQALQALEQKHIKELLIEIKKKLEEKD
jgi:Tfp pilus assembly protein PilN